VLALELKEARLPRIPLGIALLAALGAMAASSYVPPPSGYVAVTLLPFIAVIVATAQRDIAGRRLWLRRSVLIALGDASYAFYLVHAQVIHLVGSIVPKTFHYQTPARALGLWLGVFEASLGLAFLLHRGVERPLQQALRHRRRIPPLVMPRPTVSPALRPAPAI
jgi:peptidoglycan/LPS O-acetylase OafA/YrhL